jgi:trehalose-6-phosphate synthase
MGLNNRPADRQPQSHAVRFGRKQWGEYPIGGARLDTLPRVFHRYHHTSGVVDFTPYAKYPLPITLVAMASMAFVSKFTSTQESGGVWFGWSGEVVEDPTDEPGIAVDGPLTFATLDLSHRDYDEYYIGYANRVLWPLFHYRSELVEFSRRYLAGYLRVNQMFARKLAPMLCPTQFA